MFEVPATTLLVEPDPDQARRIELMLDYAGRRPASVATAVAAWDALSADPYGLVVLNVTTPGVHLLITAMARLPYRPATCAIGDPSATALVPCPWVPGSFSYVQMRAALEVALLDTRSIRG